MCTCVFTAAKSDGFLPNDCACPALEQMLYDAVVRLFTDEGVRVFACGLASRTEIRFAQSVARLKECRPVKLWTVLAYPAQYEVLGKPEQQRCRTLLNRADLRTTLLSRPCTADMEARDRFLIDHAVHVLSFDPGAAGLSGPLVYAQKRGCTFHWLPL